MWKIVLFAAALATATAANAAPRDDLLVTPNWLASHAGDKDLVILHVGTDAGYQAGHIPGARLVKDNLSVNAPEGLTMEVPPADVLREKMEALGISDNSRIVVYNENGEFQRGTRVMFSLDAAGFGDRSILLDGGLAEWKKEGRAVATDATQITPGHLSPLKMRPIVVDANFVQSHMKSPDYDLIDAREAMFYGGLVAKLDGDGHIPGAKSMPYTGVMNSDGKLKSPEELRQMFTKAGYKPGDHVIAYCQVGGQSSAVMFAGRTLGLNMQLYDGSFQDWSKRHLPIETFEYARQMKKPALFFAAALAFASPAHAADPRAALVVTPAWLTQHEADKDLVILHAGNAAGFQAGHIPGAHLADLDQISVSDPQGLSTELPSPEVLHQQLEALGISDNSRVVVYSDSETIPRATRILLTLDAAGFGKRSYLLDGGLKEWKTEGHAVTADNPPVTPGHLKPLKLDPAIVNADFVQAHLKTPGYAVIDGRAPDFYSGEQASMGGKGHLPGAKNIPFTTITGADGKLKSAEELRHMFTDAGYKPGDHVIAYCHIGIQATAVVFAARTLGIDAKLYDGSFQDWVKRGLPVETGSN